MYKINTRITPLFLSISLILFGCSSEKPAHEMSPLPVVQNQFQIKNNWKNYIGDGFGKYYSQQSPVKKNGIIYVADRNGTVEALDANSGKEIWEQELSSDSDAKLSGGISLDQNNLYIGSENAKLYSLNLTSGKVKWVIDTNSSVISKPVVYQNFVLVNTDGGNLQAFDKNNGKEIWNIKTFEPPFSLRSASSITIHDNKVFWGMSNGMVGIADLKTGNLLKQIPVGMPINQTQVGQLMDVDATPKIVGNNLYILGYNGNLNSINLSTYKLNWTIKTSSAKDFIINGSKIIFVTSSDEVRCVDLTSGKDVWKNSQLEYRFLTSPSIYRDMVMVGDMEGYLHWININTGLIVAQKDYDSKFLVPPLDTKQGIIAFTSNGDLINEQIIN